MTTTTTEEIITHLGVSAPINLWAMLGYYATDCDGITELRSHSGSTPDPLVIRGKAAAHSGADGEAVIAWALGEQTRQREETTRSCAISREAEAIQALAKSIRQSEETSILEKIMSRLSERTQYAVRQQLKG